MGEQRVSIRCRRPPQAPERSTLVTAAMTELAITLQSAALDALGAILALVSPAWVLAFLLAALNVLIFHVVVAAEAHSALYLAPFGLFGFSVGNLLAWLAGSPLPMLGDLHVIEASVGAWLVLMLANAWRSP
jgi:hypothetical protein